MLHVNTKGNIKKAGLKWDFQNATALGWQRMKQEEVVTSPDFHADDDNKITWFIELFLRIGPIHRPTIAAQFSFTLLDKDGKKIWFKDMESTTFGPPGPNDKGYGWNNLAKLTDVLKINFFSLVCQIEYEDPNPTTKISVLPSTSVPLGNEELTSSLSQNLEKLFNNRTGTDVSFIIDGKEIKAHKWMLSARSPVFAAMVESGMKESVENRVEINDIAPDIFEALLRFIYTDRVDLAQVDVQDLLVEANKYMIPLLKLECQKTLSERLTPGNCAEMLALADLHNCVHLKRSALHFIVRNRDGVMQTDGWKNLKESRSDLAFYVFENLL